MGKWEQRTDADKAMKLNEWYTLALKRGETATELIERASLIATELAMLQHDIPDKQRLDHLNQILYAHKEYETVCTSVMIQGGFTLPQFTNTIRTIDRIKQNVKQRNDSTGTENSALETRQRPSFEERQHTAMDRFACIHCGKKGHFKKTCPDIEKPQTQAGKDALKLLRNKRTSRTYTTAHTTEIDIVIDSATTPESIVKDNETIKNKRPTNISIETANKGIMKIKTRGTLEIFKGEKTH